MNNALNTAAAALVTTLCAATAWAAATVEVGESNKVFEKTAISINAGDTVNFKNNDSVAHNVMSRGADTFNLGIMKPGESKSRKFDQKGTHEVTCAMHPRMKMTVEVK